MKGLRNPFHLPHSQLSTTFLSRRTPDGEPRWSNSQPRVSPFFASTSKLLLSHYRHSSPLTPDRHPERPFHKPVIPPDITPEPHSDPTPAMNPPRPGIILVRSRPTAPEFTSSDLTAWYQKHVPELLAASGAHMTSAARYQLLDQALPEQDAEGGEHERGSKQAQEYGHELDQALPYLAVYWLRDMGWLHEEGCGFWGVDLGVDVKSGDRKERKSVFEMAEFRTEFWEVVKGLETQDGLEIGEIKSEERAESLILQFLGAEGGHAREPEAMLRNSVPVLVGAGRVRSTLFSVDESRPCPPSLRGKKGEAGLQPSEKSYLCLVILSRCPRLRSPLTRVCYPWLVA